MVSARLVSTSCSQSTQGPHWQSLLLAAGRPFHLPVVALAQGLVHPWVVQSGTLYMCNEIKSSFDLRYHFLAITKRLQELSIGFLHHKLGVVGVGFQTAPLEAFAIDRKWYRKLAALGVSQWPLRCHVRPKRTW